MKPLKISISGVRGIVGETFTPELVVSFATAFATYIEGGKVLISRDTRLSGEMVKQAVIAGLLSGGVEVVDLGICPTPAMQLMVKDTDAVGGIAITAGHNDERWNALKFVREDGLFLNAYQGEELLDVYHSAEFKKAKWHELKPIKIEDKAIKNHHNKILSVLNPSLIRKKKFKVALDCCNGACSFSAPDFLKLLGCEVVTVNDEPELPFPREPEPVPKNMGQLRALVKASGADIGFALDSDGDRLGIVTDKAVPLSEEYTFCLTTKYFAKKEKKGLIVTNLSTTSAIDEIAENYGCQVLRTKVSQAYIAEESLHRQALIGGEGSGGVLYPQINYAYDSLASISFILQFLAEEDKKIAELVKEIPKYEMIKKKIYVPPEKIYFILENIREEIENEGEDLLKSQFKDRWGHPALHKVDYQDGIRLEGDNFWLHIRASITEPLIRIIAESKNKEKIEELVTLFTRKVEQGL